MAKRVNQLVKNLNAANARLKKAQRKQAEAALTLERFKHSYMLTQLTTETYAKQYDVAVAAIRDSKAEAHFTRPIVLTESEIALARNGNRLAAIKELRARYGNAADGYFVLGLKEAKDAIDAQVPWDYQNRRAL